MPAKIHIKNMVCPRCISAVESILNQLHINFKEVRLGIADLNEDLTASQHNKLSEKLEKQGFQLINDRKASIIERIKTLIIDRIHHQNDSLSEFSWPDFLNDHLHLDYKYLSSLFSSHEQTTLEHFIISQKIERVKELLIYDELSLKEIADQLGYSSSAYLSQQFKKHTGQSPTRYKQGQFKDRKSLDKI